MILISIRLQISLLFGLTLASMASAEAPPWPSGALRYPTTNLLLNATIRSNILSALEPIIEGRTDVGPRVQQIMEAWKDTSPYSYSYLCLNLGRELMESKAVPFSERHALGFLLAADALKQANAIHPNTEFLLLTMVASNLDGAGFSRNMTAEQVAMLRHQKAELWLHCWERLSRAADSIDGEFEGSFSAPDTTRSLTPGGVGILGMGGDAIVDPILRAAYLRERELREQHNAKYSERADAIRAFKQCIWTAEEFFVRAYAWEPMQFSQLAELLQERFGMTHPAVRRILTKVAEGLPSREQESALDLVHRLPPAASLAELRLARATSSHATGPSANREMVAASTNDGARHMSRLFSNRPARSQMGGDSVEFRVATERPRKHAVEPARNTRQLLLWLLSILAATLILLVLWRARARGASGGPK